MSRITFTVVDTGRPAVIIRGDDSLDERPKILPRIKALLLEQGSRGIITLMNEFPETRNSETFSLLFKLIHGFKLQVNDIRSLPDGNTLSVILE